MLTYSSYLFIGCITIAVVFLSYQQIRSSIARRNATTQYGCKSPLAYPHKDEIFGLDAVKDDIRAFRAKTYIPRQVDQYDRYGPTFSSRFFMTPVINTVDPENVKEVLSSRFSEFSIGSRRKNAFAPLVGRGIFQLDGSQWRHSRNTIQSCLPKIQAEDLDLIERHVANLLDVLSQDNGVVDLGYWFPRLTADVTTDSFFGRSIESLKNSDAFEGDFLELMHDAQAGCEQRWKMGALANVLPHPGFKENVRRVHEFMDHHITRAMTPRAVLGEDPEKLGETHCRPQRRIFLQELSRITDDSQFIRDESLTLFFAGVDAAAALLTNLFFVLGKRPDLWHQLRDEVQPLKGERPNLSQLRSFSWHRNCVMECKMFSSPTAAISQLQPSILHTLSHRSC